MTDRVSKSGEAGLAGVVGWVPKFGGSTSQSTYCNRDSLLHPTLASVPSPALSLETQTSGPTLHQQKLSRHQVGRVRLKNRGYGAWSCNSNPKHGPRHVNEANKLHAHAVADDTGLKHYVPAVRKFLLWVVDNQLTLGSINSVDRALSDYLVHLCYEDEQGYSSGTVVVNGVAAVFVEVAKRMPETYRALKAWGRMEVQGEGAPAPWEGVAAVAGWMAKMNDAKYRQASDICMIAADCYLRKSDWKLIQHEDVVEHPDFGVAILLGVPERGESTKTGTRQGVRPDRPGVAASLLRYKSKTKPGQKLFSLTSAQFDFCWRNAATALSYDIGPPHTLRHVGPSADAASGYRGLDKIKVRGRWQAKTSVLRYAKSHTLVAAAAILPEALRKKGAAFLKQWGDRAEQAVV